MRGRSTTQESSPQRRDGEALRRELPSRSFFWGSDWRLIPRRQNRSGALNIVSSCCVSSTEVPPSRAHIPASSIATTAHGRLIGGWATTPRCPRSGPGAASSLVTPDGAALPTRPDPLPRNEDIPTETALLPAPFWMHHVDRPTSLWRGARLPLWHVGLAVQRHTTPHRRRHFDLSQPTSTHSCFSTDCLLQEAGQRESL